MPTQKKDVFAQKLVELFEESSGIEISEYGNDACFIEMGMDSLFLTQMAMQLKKEFKIQINFRQLVENFNSINALAENFVDQVQLDIPAETANVSITSAPVSVPVFSSVQIQATPAQMQLQQRSYQSQVNVNASDLEQIIQSQLELMRSQIELLQGRPVTNISREVLAQAPQVQVAAHPAPATSPVKVEEKTLRSRGADIKTAKDSFGAAAKINVEKTAKFNPTQQANVDAFFAEYIAKTKKSKDFTQKHRKRHADPRVVTGFKPENKEIIYPVVVKQSKNQTLWDLDGNTYIDMLCGFGSNFFGNGNELIKKLVLSQIEEGIEIGPQHPLVGEVSDLICELTGNDRAAFCNTGSEAVLGAMRLARTVTGREKIVVFSGSYHGINDEVIIRGAKQKPFPAAPGINNNSVSNMIVLDYGTDEALEVIRSLADDLAAVLIEPVQSRRCDFHPVEFLKEVRKITEKSQTCLIFDEVITGFRVHPAGAQGYFGIRADLCTYGKIVGGGMPIGVISGKSEYMDALDGGHWEFGDDSTPTVGVTYFAGTFVRHPLALAAAKGSLLILKEGGEKLLRDTNDRATAFAKELNLFCKEHQIPLEMNNFGSLMKPKWKQDVNGGELLFALLRYNGVHTYDGFPWFVNLAHTDDELKRVLNAFRKSFIKMQEMGLLENSVKINNSKSVFNANFPPHPKAKLGKDELGNPAWFIEDESTPGSFYLYEEMND
jgi:glutamate-1-semialdehyde aminotransferase/acyl carrier protein